MSSILAGNVVETPKILRVQDFRCFLFPHISLYILNKILKIHDKVSIAVFVYVYCIGVSQQYNINPKTATFFEKVVDSRT